MMSLRRRSGGRPMSNELIGPRDEVLHVRTIFVSAVVLTPGEFAVEQAGVDRRHPGGAIIFLLADIPCSQKTEDRAGGDGGHVAPLLVEPVGIATFGDAVAYEGGARRAQG